MRLYRRNFRVNRLTATNQAKPNINKSIAIINIILEIIPAEENTDFIVLNLKLSIDGHIKIHYKNIEK